MQFWNMLVLTIIWCLWLNRNSKIFRNNCRNSILLIIQIISANFLGRFSPHRARFCGSFSNYSPYAARLRSSCPKYCFFYWNCEHLHSHARCLRPNCWNRFRPSGSGGCWLRQLTYCWSLISLFCYFRNTNDFSFLARIGL